MSTPTDAGLEAAMLPCPFCGRAPIHDETRVWCPNGSCWGPVVAQYGGLSDAIAAWNRRTPTPTATYAEGIEAAAKVAETEGAYPELNVFAGGPDWYRHGKRIAAAIRALSPPASAQPAGAVAIPAGWRLVPEVPTDDMVAAFHSAENAVLDAEGFARPIWSKCYRAMLAASPAPSPAQPAEAVPVAWRCIDTFGTAALFHDRGQAENYAHASDFPTSKGRVEALYATPRLSPANAVEALVAELLTCVHQPNPTDPSRWDVAPGKHRQFQTLIPALRTALGDRK